MLKQIKIWSDTRVADKAKREYRVYVTAEGKREGCLYLTGNRYNAKGTRTGNLTEAEWNEARAISLARSATGTNWTTVWENEMPQAVAASAPQATSEPAAVKLPELPRNRQPQECDLCGEMVPAGEGYLYRYTDEEDIDRYGAGWKVYHLDKELCSRNVEAMRARKAEARAHEAVKAQEREELAERVTAETDLIREADWSFDDYRFSRGAVLAETEHFRAYEYRDGKTVIGFTIREK